MSDKPVNFPLGTVVEVSIIGSVSSGAYLELQTMANEMQATLMKRFVELGGKAAHPRWAEVRPATREELLHFIPRKVHYSENGQKWICDTAHVSRRNLTSNKEAVTCRLCRRKLGVVDES